MRSAYELRANLQRIFGRFSAHLAHVVCNRMRGAKSRIVRRKARNVGAELSGLMTGDHRNAPERHRATLTFFILIFWTVRWNCSPVPGECVQLADNFRIARQS